MPRGMLRTTGPTEQSETRTQNGLRSAEPIYERVGLKTLNTLRMPESTLASLALFNEKH